MCVGCCFERSGRSFGWFVCTTSLIRKIDRALFTFWLYIICRRRCVILIFSWFFFVRFYVDMYFSFSSHLFTRLLLLVWLCLHALCDQNALFSFVLRSLTRSLKIWFFDYYIIIVDTDMRSAVCRSAAHPQIHHSSEATECASRFIIIFGGFLSYSLHTYYFSVTPLFVLFIFILSPFVLSHFIYSFVIFIFSHFQK